LSRSGYWSLVRGAVQRLLRNYQPILCTRTAWAGCGQHVDQVMRGVAKNDRCRGEHVKVKPSGSFFSRLFGR